MIRLALASALSDRARRGPGRLVDCWRFEAPRTKDAVAALGALGARGQVLVVLGTPDDELHDQELPQPAGAVSTD